MSDHTEADLPTGALKSALEFAVGIAAASARHRPPLSFPSGLKKFLKSPRLPSSALGMVRAAVEGDPDFRHGLGVAASGELVDEVGRLWLAQPEGWLDHAMALVERSSTPVTDESNVRTERKRREAAEAATTRARLEVMALQTQLAELQAQLDGVEAERRALAAEVARVAGQLQEERAGARRAASKGAANELARVTAELDAARAETIEVRAVLDGVLAARAHEGPAVDVARLRELLLEALSFTGSGADVARRPRRQARRTALPIPGGLYGNSEEAAEHLLKVPGVVVLVDGYNVAKLGWPSLSLEQQRQQLVQRAEALARRWGTDLHIVFDGSDEVEGAHTRQRALVRISWSPTGVLADDVLRAEVQALDPARPVVVVTNDRAVLTDVRAAGANTISSDALLAVLRR